MIKPISDNYFSQAEDKAKNKKSRKERSAHSKNIELQILNIDLHRKPAEMSHKDGLELRLLLSSLTSRNLKAVKVMFREIVKEGNILQNKARSYFRKASGFTCDESITRLVKRLELAGILSVIQFIPRTNWYSLGPILKDSIVMSYVVKHIPSLRMLLPPLFALSLLISQNAHSEQNVTQPKRYIYSYLKSKSLYITKKEGNEDKDPAKKEMRDIVFYKNECCRYKSFRTRKEKIDFCRSKGMGYEDDVYVTPVKKEYLCGLSCDVFKEFDKRSFEALLSVESKAKYLDSFGITYRITLIPLIDKKRLVVDQAYRHLVM